MADAPWLRSVTEARRRVADALQLRIAVTVSLATGEADSVSGATPRRKVEAHAVVRGHHGSRVSPGGDAHAAAWQVDLYDFRETLREGDVVEWGGREHPVRRVIGLVKNGDGALYSTRALTD